MKLIAQTNRYYLLMSMAALVIISTVLLLGIRHLFNRYSDERLDQMKTEIEIYVKNHGALPVFFESTNSKVYTNRTDISIIPTYSDTLIFNEIEQEDEPFRRLRFGLVAGSESLQVDVLLSSVETEDIALMVLLLNLSILIAILAMFFWTQRKLSVRLWEPFNNTLEQLRHFNLSQKDPLVLGKTNTDEFSELNKVIQRLTEKNRQDFNSLKRFTENASHEIQTPLSVIRIKLETLLQSDGLGKEQLTDLNSASSAAARLSRLQQSLLLLVKIENDQFPAKETIDLKSMVETKLDLLEDFISAKNILVQAELSSVQLIANPFLIDTLIGNLIGNAIKHNLPKGGVLSVQLSEQKLMVANSGNPPSLPVTELIERFRRNSQQTDGLGLGLAIVKEICDQYDWKLEVGFDKNVWTSTIHFDKQNV
ncbi:MAG: HAMP domain-containing sensor histidine kinase [Saprospiraceae bacterium]